MIQATAISSGWPEPEELEEIAESDIKEMIGKLFRACVSLSPVYTGAYRASWRVSFNEPRTDVTDGRTPLNPIRGASFRWPAGFKLGDTVIVSNNQPYADEIEHGHSSQAPYGVVSLAVTFARLT